MKKSKIIALASIIALNLGVVGGTVAYVFAQNAKASATGQVDDIVYLEWLQTEDIGNIVLELGQPIEKYIAVAKPKKSSDSLPTKGQVTFTLKAQDEKTIDGLTCKIATSTWNVTAGSEPTALATLSSTTLEYKSEAIDADTTYYLQFAITDEAYNDYFENNLFGATMTISYGEYVEGGN